MKPLFTWHLKKGVWCLGTSCSLPWFWFFWWEVFYLHHYPHSSPALFFLFWEGGSFLSLLKSHQSRSTPLTCNRLKHNRFWRAGNCTLFYGAPFSRFSFWRAGDCVKDTYSSFPGCTCGCTTVCVPQPHGHRNCTQPISRQAVFLDLSL